MKIALIALASGTLAGLVGALCGVGGGIVMVPLFVGALKLDQKTAVATSLAIIVITALSGTLSNLHSKAGLIDWRIVAFAAVGAATASWFGAEWMRSLSNQTLTKTFGIILLVSGLRMILAKG